MLIDVASKLKRVTSGVYLEGDSYIHDAESVFDTGPLTGILAMICSNRPKLTLEMKYPKLQKTVTSGYEAARCSSFGSYGVCDNWQQVVKQCSNLSKDNPTPYVLVLHPVTKSGQTKTHGWRWHRWGDYIGVQKPKCEYLYDEPKISLIYCYTILQVPEDLIPVVKFDSITPVADVGTDDDSAEEDIAQLLSEIGFGRQQAEIEHDSSSSSSNPE